MARTWLLIADVVIDLCDDTNDHDIEGLSAINTEALTGGEKTTYPFPLAQADAKSCARSLNIGVFSELEFCWILHSDRGSVFVSPTTETTKYIGTM